MDGCTHPAVSSRRSQHTPALWPRSVCWWSRCRFYWSRRCSLLAWGCPATPQPDPGQWRELTAGRCGPAAERSKGINVMRATQIDSSCCVACRSLTSTSSPVVYINSLTKLIAAGSPHTWISSAQRPAHTERHTKGVRISDNGDDGLFWFS